MRKMNSDMSEISFYKKIFERNIINAKNAIYGRHAGNYTKSYETWKMIENILSCFQDELKRKRDRTIEVLDLGCGDGYHIFLLNSLKEEAKEKIYFRGIDISSLNVYSATEIAKSIEACNVNFEVGNVENLALSDSCFDIVLCTDVIEHLVNPEKCLTEMIRLLNPGGLAIVTTTNRDNKFAKILKRLIPIRSYSENKQVDYYSSGQKDRFFDIGHGHISVKSMDEWIDIFRDKGFIIEDIKRGSMLFGGYRCNIHPILFALTLIADRISDYCSLMKKFSEAHTFKLRKPL
ncbi:MAG TPA: class I SAM-dependent methyltransferase [Nitrospirae bacterium]|nr:putative S-adenosylmethionine-dependent methyltransferase/MSMEI_2290 [bacterium BMS3Abin06]HDH13556.1 class I SAM-dependent methyltransferase [Nitrospirota bacterium]HDZ01004.1 class I SAM-dependent methyltransferase [Nitrospirota bacterium]